MSHSRKTVARTVAALTMTVMLAIMSLRPALAQDAGTLVDDATYETVGGAEITWDGGWATLGDFYGYDEDTGGDYVFLELDNAESGRISILEYPEDETDMDAVVDVAFEAVSEPPYGDLLMEDHGDDAVTILYTANDGSGPPEIAYFVYLVEHDGRIYHAHASSRIATFERLITAIADDIEIDGEPVLDGVDIDEVMATLAGNEPIERADPDDDEDETGATGQDEVAAHIVSGRDLRYRGNP